MKTVKATAFALLLGSAAAFAQSPTTTTTDPTATGKPEVMARDIPDFRTLDTNGDGRLTKEEVASNSHVSGKFAELDADSNGSLSVSEFAKAKGKDKGDKTKPTDPSSTTSPNPAPSAPVR